MFRAHVKIDVFLKSENKATKELKQLMAFVKKNKFFVALLQYNHANDGL